MGDADSAQLSEGKVRGTPYSSLAVRAAAVLLTTDQGILEHDLKVSTAVQQASPRRTHLSTTSITRVATNEQHSLALSSAGQAFSWGTNLHGECGHGHHDFCEVATLIQSFHKAALQIIEVACGRWHSVAIAQDGAAYTWGRGDDGQLGLGITKRHAQSSPQMVEGLGAEDVHSCCAGVRHTVLLTSSAQVWTCGWNGFGQLGHSERDTMYDHEGNECPLLCWGMDSSGVKQACFELRQIMTTGSQKISGIGCGHWHSLFF